MTDTITWDYIDRFLWGITITILVLCAVQYVLRGKKRDVPREKLIMFGFACFFIGFASEMFFVFLRDSVVP